MRSLTGWKARLRVAYVLLILGTTFFTVSLASILGEVAFLARSQSTPGTVSRNVKTLSSVSVPSPTDKTGTEKQVITVFCPEINYTDAAGQRHTFTSTACADPPSFAVGQQLTVQYLSAHPSHAQVDSFGAKWGLAVAFGIVAATLLPVATLLFLLVRGQGHSVNFSELIASR